MFTKVAPAEQNKTKMEKNYINSSDAQAKSMQWAQQLENSPVDKHKAKFGETD